jgi:catechol 2,3-dioxygenase-like lactoylglutathione lyase family enzyme
MPTIVHFEIPADDVERSKKFYGDLFGWKIEKWPGSTVDDKEYWMITTTGEKGNKALGGGMMTQHQNTNFIDVETVDEYSSNNNVRTDFTYTSPSTLQPGQRAPFDMIVIEGSIPLHLVAYYTLSGDY